MGNALGLGLVSVVFFGSIGDDLVPPQLNQAFVDGFQHSLWYVAGVLAVIFLVMFALPAGRSSTSRVRWTRPSSST